MSFDQDTQSTARDMWVILSVFISCSSNYCHLQSHPQLSSYFCCLYVSMSLFRHYGLKTCRSLSILRSCYYRRYVFMRAFLVEKLIPYVYQLRKLIIYGGSQKYVARIGFSWTVILRSLGISSWWSWGFQIWLFECVCKLFSPSFHPSHSSVFYRGRFTNVTLFSKLTRGFNLVARDIASFANSCSSWIKFSCAVNTPIFFNPGVLFTRARQFC